MKASNYLNFHTVLHILWSHSLPRLIEELETDLPQDQFLRIHKSYIISRAKVSTLEGNMIHIGKEKIPIEASYREEILKILF